MELNDNCPLEKDITVIMVRKDSRLRTKTSRYLSQKSSSSTEDPPKSSKPPSRDGGGGGFSHSARPESKEKDPSSKSGSTDYMKGRLPIKAATMNLSGQSVMGLTPAYKLNYIRYLSNFFSFTVISLMSLMSGSIWRHCLTSSSFKMESEKMILQIFLRRYLAIHTPVNFRYKNIFSPHPMHIVF